MLASLVLVLLSLSLIPAVSFSAVHSSAVAVASSADTLMSPILLSSNFAFIFSRRAFSVVLPSLCLLPLILLFLALLSPLLPTLLLFLLLLLTFLLTL